MQSYETTDNDSDCLPAMGIDGLVRWGARYGLLWCTETCTRRRHVANLPGSWWFISGEQSPRAV